MKLIPEDKLEIHLKLGRTVAQFVKTGVYFDDRTFDWIKLEKTNDLYKATLIRSIDEGDESHIEVAQFETVNETDEFENEFKEGNREEVFLWMTAEFQINPSQFHDLNGLNQKYLDLVVANKLGN